MISGIKVKVWGDFGPFSSMGKSIGYQVTIGASSYLIDCGAPLFQQVGGRGLKSLTGMIVTHCHEDHKRWFTDIALFNAYTSGFKNKVFLLTSERINKEIARGSRPALETSLSADSSKVIDLPYESYVDFMPIGPRPKLKIESIYEGNGRVALRVVDGSGTPVGPESAKIIMSGKTGRPRLLFKDPVYGEWVEPESFYPFSSDTYYEKDGSIYNDPEGFTIEAINAPVWHGIASIGVKFKTERESLVFSSDTVHDVKLWKTLHEEKHQQNLGGMSREEFESATVIEGDINDFIERTWSRERYEDAIKAFDDSIVIHDVADRNSVVHTDYIKLKDSVLKKENVLLTHSPDTMISEWALSRADKEFLIIGKECFEIAGDGLFKLNADIYQKKQGRFFIGYKNENGRYSVYENDGLPRISDGDKGEGAFLYRVDLYEDIGGRYFPVISDNRSKYMLRDDGRVELVEYSEGGSKGSIVEDQRERLAEKVVLKPS